MATFRPKQQIQTLDPTQMLKLACPVCATAFEVKAGESVVDRGVQWSQEGRPSVGLLTYSFDVLIEHTCPEGTEIEVLP